MKDELVEQLNRGKLFHNFVIEEYPKGNYAASLRNMLFRAFCDLEIEHHGAVLILIESGQHDGSALALLRPMVEACIRAYWTLYCADDGFLKAIVKEQHSFPSLDRCSKAVDDFFAKQSLKGFDISSGYLRNLHGLTHGGLEQLQYRFDAEFNIRPTYPAATILRLLQQASMWLAMTAISDVILIEGENTPGNDRISRKYVELFDVP
jgi:hypothetical protein